MIRCTAWLLSLAATAAVAADTDGLARCASIAPPDARLACYDALAHRPADRTPEAAAEKPAAAAAQKSAPAPASAAAMSAADPKNFGLSLDQQHMAFAGPTAIKARVDAISSAADGQTYILLDSGQTWITGENDGWLSKGDAVIIKRATLGAFLLRAPSNHSYHVRRVK
jgi:hypothetical protein